MEVDQFLSNCDENYSFHSKLCDKIQNEECVLGIDEAGRGPVLGMYATVMCRPTAVSFLFYSYRFRSLIFFVATLFKFTCLLQWPNWYQLALETLPAV